MENNQEDSELEIAFIVCTNNKKYMEECKFYIEKLYVPDGMEVSVIPIENPRSMTIGYNKAMKASSARYKVYLHQDMFIVNRNFIFDIADCFESDSNIGMIGVAGIRKLRDASVWNSLDIGGCYSVGTFSGVGSIAVKPQINNPDSMYQEVDYIDGMLMASQYDIEWDEKIEGFHFYDVSQCERFRKSGYKVVVAKQDEIWTFHDFGPLNLKTYRNNQKKFCELYGYNVEDDQDNTAVYELCETVAVALKPMFESRDFEKIGKLPV